MNDTAHRGNRINRQPGAGNKPSSWLVAAALAVPLTLTTPLNLALLNPEDVSVNPVLLLSILAALAFVTTLVIMAVIRLLPSRIRSWICALVLSLSAATAVQAYAIHGLFDYGVFNGTPINWQKFGIWFWLESLLLIVFMAAVIWFIRPRPGVQQNLALLLIILALVQPVGNLGKMSQLSEAEVQSLDFDASVFGFSRNLNVIHLLPDGFQSDLAQEVLAADPELASRFEGFTLYSDHLGQFQGTAPSVPTMLTGRRFDLDAGYNYPAMKQDLEANSYQVKLVDRGFRMDFVPLSIAGCIKAADSCVPRPFNDLKARGYYMTRTGMSSFAKLTDLTLFRHGPLSLKQFVYADGRWVNSSKSLDGASPYPDPVLHEWQQNMTVDLDQPVYKWYHYIGTHTPPQWDSQCEYDPTLERSRENYLSQARCVLEGMASFFDRLRAEDIYDRTIIVVSADHGVNIEAPGLDGDPVNYGIYNDRFFGTAHPLFMIKPLNDSEPYSISDLPTAMVDVGPTLMDLVDVSPPGDDSSPASTELSAQPNEQANELGLAVSLLQLDETLRTNRRRSYHRYQPSSFWSGEPVEYVSYEVRGDARQRDNWRLTGLHGRIDIPSAYDRIAMPVIGEFSEGLSLSLSKQDSQKAAWVPGHEFYLLMDPSQSPENQDSMHQLIVQYCVPQGVDEQSVTVSVNGRQLALDHPLVRTDRRCSNEWQELNLEVPSSSLQQSENFWIFHFRNLWQREDGKPPLSILLRSIELS